MIGKNLQKLRKQRSMTQEALAEAVGVARQTIAKWETEESTPDLEMSGRLASVLEVSLDDLVNAPEDELDSRPGMRGKHMFGVVTVGDNAFASQMVLIIPAESWDSYQEAGDQLMVLGDENSGIALVNAEFFMAVAEEIKNGL